MVKQHKKGSIVFVMLCINIWCALLIGSFIQIVGLAQYVAVKHTHTYLDECRFNLLIDIAKKYIEQYKGEGICEGIIFNEQVMLDDIDTFKGKIKLISNKKQHDITVTVRANGRKKIMQKTL